MDDAHGDDLLPLLIRLRQHDRDDTVWDAFLAHQGPDIRSACRSQLTGEGWIDVAVAEGLILTGTVEAPNLSTSGLAAKQVVAEGWHRPLVDALERGTVDAVLIQLGNDDLSGYVLGIASTIPPPAEDEAIAAAVVADLQRIVRELRKAGGDRPLFLCTVPDWGQAPGLRGALKALPTGLRRRITRVTAAINDGVRRLAEADGCVVIDLAGLLAKWRSLPPPPPRGGAGRPGPRRRSSRGSLPGGRRRHHRARRR